MKWFLAGLVGVALVVGGVIWKLHDNSKIRYSQDRAIVEWQAAKLADAVIRARPDAPGSWGAGIYLANAGMVAAASALDGLSITSEADDVVVTIEKVRVTTRATLMDAEFGVRAKSEKRNATASFNVAAVVSFAGIEQQGKETAVIRLGVIPVEIVPEFGWYGLSFSGRGLISDMVSGGILARLMRDGAGIPIPVPNGISRTLPSKLEKTFPINKELNSSVTGEATLPEITLSGTMKSVVPLFLKDGVWFLASETETPGIASALLTKGLDREELVKETAEIRAAIEKIAPPPGEATIWVGADLMVSAINRIAKLPPVTFRSTSVRGRLAEIKQDLHPLGKAEAYAEFTGADAVDGHVTLGLTPRWVSGSGLQIDTAIGGHANAKVKVSVKVPMAPGIGTSVGLVGDAGLQISAAPAFSVESVEGNKVLLGRLGGTCGDLKIALKSDGKAKTDLGWATVPAIGGILSVGIDPAILPPIALIDDVPRSVSGRSQDGSPILVEKGGRKLLIEPKWRFLEVKLVPLPPKATPRGWMLGTEIKIIQTGMPADVTKADAAREAVRLAVAKMKGQPACKDDGKIEVTLGDIKIGPDNELVKWLVEIGHFTKEVGQKFLEEADPGKRAEWALKPKETFERHVQEAKALADRLAQEAQKAKDLAEKLDKEKRDLEEKLKKASGLDKIL